MTHDSDPGAFTPPPFSFALMGHLATGVVKAFAIALLLWGLGFLGCTASVPVGTAIITAAVVMIAVELATSAVERVFVHRHQHPDPGSIPMTLIVAALPLPISFLVGRLLEPSPPGALITMTVTTAVYWIALLVLERSWVEGDTQTDIRRKYEQTKDMSRDQFRSE